MKSTEIIQIAFNKLRDSNFTRVPIYEIVPTDKRKEVDPLEGFNHFKPREFIKNCGLFTISKGEGDIPIEYISLNEKGWMIATDYEWSYLDYVEKMKPVSNQLMRWSVVANILVGVLIFFQLCATVYQIIQSEESQKEVMSLLKELLIHIQ